MSGHIAKAEKELAEYIKKVDVVIEVRDSRIPLSTAHPLVPKWIGNRPHLVAMMRTDQASHKSLVDWKSYYSSEHYTAESKVFFVEGKLGRGIEVLRKHIARAGKDINNKRKKMGILTSRPVRAAVIGYPNVGKSTLINRILRRKLARTRNIAGHTRTMQWIRIGPSPPSKGKGSGKDGGAGGSRGGVERTIELLDSPGVIPAKHVDQYAAMSLAICNDIGQAAYDNQHAATALLDRVLTISRERGGYVNLEKVLKRYRLEPEEGLLGEDILLHIAQTSTQDSLGQAAAKVLGDFRKGYWGHVTLEAPPVMPRRTARPRRGEPLSLVSGAEEQETYGGDREVDIDEDEEDIFGEDDMDDGNSSDYSDAEGEDYSGDLINTSEGDGRNALDLQTGSVDVVATGTSDTLTDKTRKPRKIRVDTDSGPYDGW